MLKSRLINYLKTKFCDDLYYFEALEPRIFDILDFYIEKARLITGDSELIYCYCNQILLRDYESFLNCFFKIVTKISPYNKRQLDYLYIYHYDLYFLSGYQHKLYDVMYIE